MINSHHNQDSELKALVKGKGKSFEVYKLIEAGCSPNLKYGFMGWSLLHEAIDKDSLDTVKVLIDAKAEINVEGGFKKLTPLTIAINNKNLEIVKFAH